MIAPPTDLPHILVADDQPDILQALRLLLGDAGYETRLVRSATDVVDWVEREPFDLLLMDLNYSRDTTSGGEGLALLDQVHKHDSTLPVVVMTGWGTIDTAVEAMRRGAKSFVQKPWDDSTLVEVVRREIAEGRAVRRRDAQLSREQDEARLIQRALLPVAMPQLAGCELAAIWTPAYGIGGDCYDVLAFSESRLAVSIADVVGKGLPAALLMSNLQAAVRAFSTAATEPQDLCTSVNRLLCRNITSGKFVTFCYAVVDIAERCIRHANAGHNPPILMRQSGEVDRLSPTGLVLGIASDWVYDSGVTDIRPGDRLVCFTDGITEAASEDGDQFGEERLIDCVARHRHQTPDVLARAISDEVALWTHGIPSDDATLIIAALE